jgi:hypothetical protein
MPPPSDRAEVERKIVFAPRVKICCGPRLLELAGPERVRELLKGQNAKPVVARKTGRVVAIELLEYGNDTRLRSRSGNPQALSHDVETDTNPRGVWALKKLPLIGRT